MSDWNPLLFKEEGLSRGVSSELIDNGLETAAIIQSKNSRLPPLLTLGHLAFLSGTDYAFLRRVVERKVERAYRVFQIRKRPGTKGERRFRTIAVPQKRLMRAQRWICQALLSVVSPHSSSVAFSKGSTLLAAAQPHCCCRWLIKLDVKNFFESINEIGVYRVFRSLGYQPLLSFELARICTRDAIGSTEMSLIKRRIKSRANSKISTYITGEMGHLPQGASTSPMLANLVMMEFDREISRLAEANGMIYTRYADDIALSSRDKNLGRKMCETFIKQVFVVMGKWGLSPNASKTRISSPGARKVVLGLLVNGPQPRLTRDFRDKLSRHIHYLVRADVGPTKHASARGFSSTIGLRNHVYGLVSFAHQIDPDFALKKKLELASVKWPA